MTTIREIEANILDKEFLKFKLMHRSQDDAIPHMLKIVGDFWRESDDNVTSPALFKPKVDLLLGGLSHCIRWIVSSQEKIIKLPKATNFELDQEAIDFLGWGMHYHMLFTDHVAWSRGMINASIDESSRTIEFSFKSVFDTKLYLANLLEFERTIQLEADKLPLAALETDFPKWKSYLRFDGKTFRTADNTSQFNTAYSAIIDWLNDIVFPEIDRNENINGYSLNEFFQFYSSLLIQCVYWKWIEDSFDSKFGDENPLGSSIIALSRSAMVKWLKELSRLEKKIIEAILNDLTFDNRRANLYLIFQPFVKSSKDNLYLLPRLFTQADPLRLFSGALNKSDTGRKAYEKIIEPTSFAMVQKIISVLEKNHRLQIFHEKKFIDDSGKEYSPDLIVFDKSNQELLIADYKHSLSPFGPAEVFYKLSEFEKAIRQIRGYLVGAKGSKWVQSFKPSKVICLLVFRYPMLIPINGYPDIAITNWDLLIERLSNSPDETFSELVEFLKLLPETIKGIEPLRTEKFEIKVADWTYRRSITVGDRVS